MPNPPDAWLRGPVPGIVPELVPVAHTLIQAREEVERLLADAGERELWLRPAGAAAAGFHLKHAAGALDRLFTYARGDALSPAQRAALAEESVAGPAAPALAAQVLGAIDRALQQLADTPAAALDTARPIGRAALPATTRGALIHGAEHLYRHVGQCATTLRILRGLAVRSGRPGPAHGS